MSCGILASNTDPAEGGEAWRRHFFLAVHEPYLFFTSQKGNCVVASAFTGQSPEVSTV